MNHQENPAVVARGGLRVPQRRRRKRVGTSTTPNVPTADAPNVVWAVDFPFDATTDGRPVKIVSIVDEHTRACLSLVDRSITSDDLINELDRLAARRGHPAVLRRDNGPELACAAMSDWASERVGLHFIPPGDPWQNGYVESFNSGRPVAGKTGTATDYSTAWFIGYVPQLAATVWVGDPEGGARYPLRGVIVGGRGFSKVFGGTIPAPIWGDFMRQALKGQPIKRFDSPDPSVVAGTQVTMPDVRGLTIIRARARLADVGLTGLVVRQEVSSVYPKGTVARASPGSGNSIGLGSSVLLYISAG